MGREVRVSILVALEEPLCSLVRAAAAQALPGAETAAVEPALLSSMMDRRWDLVITRMSVAGSPNGIGFAELNTDRVLLVADQPPPDLPERVETVSDADAPETVAARLVNRLVELFEDRSIAVPFDMDRFISSYADSPDIMREILTLYRAEAPVRLETIRRELPRSGFPALAKAAHSLANTCGTLGAGDAVEEARALEIAARANDVDACRVHGEPLAELVERIVDEVADYLDSTEA